METTKPISPEVLEEAQRLFIRYRIQCFWSWPEDAVITPELFPAFIKGLATHGGHEGFKLAARLCR